MKPFRLSAFFIVLLLLAFSSCSKYYINTVSSTNLQSDQNTGNFKYENDSLLLTYSFFGENAPVHIEVQNKLDEPLYIDWSRSALVLNNKAVTFSGNKVDINGDFSADSYKWSKSFQITDGSLNATATLPEGITFIPPRSHIDRVPLMVTNAGFDNLPDSVYNERDMLYPASGPIKVKSASFSEKNSPLRFQSYLTLYTGADASVRRIAYMHNFFISKSIKTTARPGNMAEYNNKSGNLFYTSKRTAYAKAITGAAIATVVIAGSTVQKNDTDAK